MAQPTDLLTVHNGLPAVVIAAVGQSAAEKHAVSLLNFIVTDQYLNRTYSDVLGWETPTLRHHGSSNFDLHLPRELSYVRTRCWKLQQHNWITLFNEAKTVSVHLPPVFPANCSIYHKNSFFFWPVPRQFKLLQDVLTVVGVSWEDGHKAHTGSITAHLKTTTRA